MIYVVHRAGPDDWTLFYTGAGWSNERPDAEEFATENRAKKAMMDYAKRKGLTWLDVKHAVSISRENDGA